MISLKALHNRPLWVMHGGTERQAHSDFVIRKYISLESPKLGDLRFLPDDPKKWLARYRRKYPRLSLRSASAKSGELYRFFNEMKSRHFVVYPSRDDKLVHIGLVTGEYRFLPNVSSHHPHARKIRWLKQIKRKSLPPNARRAISGPRAIYQPLKYLEILRRSIAEI
jgi:restriction system protein